MTGFHEDQARRLQDLLAYPRESLDIEFKSWLDLSQKEDAANFAKAVLALANHGGGYVVLGFSEHSGEWLPAEERPSDLSGYDQDRVNGIVHHYADPPFQCEVHNVLHPASGDAFPVVVVPGEHPVPIRAKCDGPDGVHVRQHSYYIRRPGPRSEAIRTAREWDQLIRRCMAMDREGLLASIRVILAGTQPSQKGLPLEDSLGSGLSSWTDDARQRFAKCVQDELADEKPSRYAHGTWDVAYALSEVHPVPDLRKLRAILQEVEGHETGWPPWMVLPAGETIAPRPSSGAIQCWLRDSGFADAAHSDFWRASPEGMMFLLRGYQDDGGHRHLTPGTSLDPVIPVWRVGECLLHAARLARAMADEPTQILFRMQWRGLTGRRIRWVAGRRFGPRGSERVCEQDAVDSEVTTQSSVIEDTLPELVEALVSPLCEAFAFYELPKALSRRSLRK